MNKIMFKP